MDEITCSKCNAANALLAKFCSQCATPLPQPPPTREQLQSGKTSVWFWLLLIPGIVLVFYFCTRETVEGEIRSRGKPLGDYTLKGASCRSGEHETFFGVWVGPEVEHIDGHTGIRGGLKLVKTHLEEWAVFIESPKECQGFKCKIFPVEKARCKVFDVEVHNTSTEINDITARAGHATLECAFPEGGALSVKLEFDGCS